MGDEEPQDILDADRRVALRDLTPDAPWLESDASRSGGYDEYGQSRGGGSMSRGQLSRRFNCGESSDATPYIPDQFTDQEFLVKDPRGVYNEPDFNEYNRQRRARGKFVKLYNDDDLSVPESGINPTQMAKNIRQDMHKQSRSRLKIFSTSKDNMVVGYKQSGYGTSQVPTVTLDGTIVDLNKVDAPYRHNRTTILSNMSEVGWMATPDQEFKVAQYGDIRRTTPLDTPDYNRNRRAGEVSATDVVEVDGQFVTKAMALTMADRMRERATRQEVYHGTSWAESQELQTRDQRGLFIGGAAEVLAAIDSVELNERGIEQFTSRQQRAMVRRDFDAEVSQHVAEFMDSATRRSKTKVDGRDTGIDRILDARDESMEWSTRAAREKMSTLSKHRAEIHEAEESKEVAVYSHKPTVAPNYHNQEGTQLAGDHNEHTTRRSKKQNKKGRAYGTEDFALDGELDTSVQVHRYAADQQHMKDKLKSRRRQTSTHQNDDYDSVMDL
jgi:hypothetical protein